MTDLSPLFETFACKTMHLRNRIVMSPMTRLFAPGGVLIDKVDDYYGRRAAGGVGLIVTEGTAVGHDVAHYSDAVPHFYGEAALARWQRVVDRVHAQGGAIAPQLWHTGLARRRSHTHNPEAPNQSPSALIEDDLKQDKEADKAPNPGKVRRPSAAMAMEDIEAVIAAFARGAADAQRIGCDGVEIHGAHGYLLDQFFWERSNRRDDAYGGSLENRIRFAVEIVAAVRAATGPDFPILFRFSQWKAQDYAVRIADSPAELARILEPLADAGVDIFDASTRRFWLPEFDGSPLNLAGWAKKLTGKAAMTVGSVSLESVFQGGGEPVSPVTGDNLRLLAEMMARGDFDLVAVGRAMIANPDWANLVREGRLDAFRAYDAAAHVKTLEQTGD